MCGLKSSPAPLFTPPQCLTLIGGIIFIQWWRVKDRLLNRVACSLNCRITSNCVSVGQRLVVLSPLQERKSGYEFKQYLVGHCLEWARATTSASEGLFEKFFL